MNSARTVSSLIVIGMILSAGCVSPERFEKSEKERIESEKQIIRLESELKAERLISDMRFRQLEQKFAEQSALLKESIPIRKLFQRTDHNGMPFEVVEIYLDTIRPKKEATPAEIRKYIDTIASMSRHGNYSDLTRRCIVSELAQLGPEYLEDLLTYSGWNFFNEAIQRQLAKLNRQQLKELMSGNNSNVVIEEFTRRATADDKEFLMNNILRTNCFRALQRLGFEREAINKFIHHLKQNHHIAMQQRSVLENILQKIQSKERDELIAFLWDALVENRNPNSGYDQWGTMELALTFAQYGYLPSFHFLGKNYNLTYPHNQHTAQRIALLSPVSTIKFPAWYEKNKDKIVFSPEEKRFIVR